MGAIFWEKGKIFGNLGKKVQNWKIFWKKAGHCIWEIACNKLLEKVLLELDLTLIKWHIFAESWSNFLGCYDGVTAISLYITINVNKITRHFFNFDKVTLAIFEQVKKCPLVFLLTLLRSLLQFSLKWASNVFLCLETHEHSYNLWFLTVHVLPLPSFDTHKCCVVYLILCT